MSTDRLTTAALLGRVAEFLEFRGENPFRVRAFRNAAKAVLGLPGSVADALRDGSLAQTRGIGPATLGLVTEFLETGQSSYLEQLKQEIPAGLVDMLNIPGLGVSRIKLVHEQLRIDTVMELEEAARDGRLARLKGFGPKTAEKVLKGIAFAEGARAYRLGSHAVQEAEVLRSALAALPGVTRAQVAGEVRRRCEVVSELALVVMSELGAAEARKTVAELPGLSELAGNGGTLSFRSPGGMPAVLRITSAERFGAAFIQATGNRSHLEQLTAHAATRGYHFTAEGLLHGNRAVPAPDEAACYASLGLAEIPPELREGYDEIARAAAGTLPRLVEHADLLGFLHCHTTWSDGSQDVEELALACRDAGYAYVGITDHSQSAAYAGGLTAERVLLQWQEIDRVAAGLQGIRILKGIECDILVDGELDYDAELLAGFDFVIGSIHSRFSLGKDEMTTRLLRALDNPHLTILGHPTGRLLLSRNPYPLDLERVFARAADQGVALEINGDPHRLDLDWRQVRRARELGVKFALGADSHSRSNFVFLEYATAIARKGGLEAGDVLNALPADRLLEFARARRP